jgi:hypothetical protein
MLNVTYKPFVLSVIMLSVIRLNVIMLSVVAPCKRNFKPNDKGHSSGDQTLVRQNDFRQNGIRSKGEAPKFSASSSFLHF